jgi:hypothetical protein
MNKTRFSLQENFPDDGISIAAEINRKLNLDKANKANVFSVNSILFKLNYLFHPRG